MRLLIVTIGLSFASIMTALAQSGNTNDIPANAMVLVQSELDHLASANRKISVEFDKVVPEAALTRIGKSADLSIEIHGSLPKTPLLSKSFENVTVKEVLVWFAETVPVLYRAEGSDKLAVMPASGARHERSGDS